jgi:hypothetical protein
MLAGNSDLASGLSDAYAVPEVVWRFSIRRLMVPFLPAKAIATLTNKVNGAPFNLGNPASGGIQIARQCVRAEAPEVIAKRAPDGQLYWDIKLKFLVRQLFDEYWDPVADSRVRGWITWNYAYGIPSTRLTSLGWPIIPKTGYFPVCWNSGLVTMWGTNHPLFIRDIDVAGGLELSPSLFTKGFRANE